MDGTLEVGDIVIPVCNQGGHSYPLFVPVQVVDASTHSCRGRTELVQSRGNILQQSDELVRLEDVSPPWMFIVNMARWRWQDCGATAGKTNTRGLIEYPTSKTLFEIDGRIDALLSEFGDIAVNRDVRPEDVERARKMRVISDQDEIAGMLRNLRITEYKLAALRQARSHREQAAAHKKEMEDATIQAITNEQVARDIENMKSEHRHVTVSPSMEVLMSREPGCIKPGPYTSEIMDRVVNTKFLITDWCEIDVGVNFDMLYIGEVRGLKHPHIDEGKLCHGTINPILFLCIEEERELREQVELALSGCNYASPYETPESVMANEIQRCSGICLTGDVYDDELEPCFVCDNRKFKQCIIKKYLSLKKGRELIKEYEDRSEGEDAAEGRAG